MLIRAAALRHTDLTDFVLQPALREAKAVIEESERIALSEHDSLLVLNLLESPPAPNAKLRAAIAAMPKPTRRHEEPISKKHNRRSFDCGDPSMNDFLQRYARQSHESGAAKTFLAIDNGDNKTILGFCGLAPSSGLRRRARNSSPRPRPARHARVSARTHRYKPGLAGPRSRRPATRRRRAAVPRLRSGALCSSSMQRTTAQRGGTPITGLSL